MCAISSSYLIVDAKKCNPIFGLQIFLYKFVLCVSFTTHNSDTEKRCIRSQASKNLQAKGFIRKYIVSGCIPSNKSKRLVYTKNRHHSHGEGKGYGKKEAIPVSSRKVAFTERSKRTVFLLRLRPRWKVSGKSTNLTSETRFHSLSRTGKRFPWMAEKPEADENPLLAIHW